MIIFKQFAIIACLLFLPLTEVSMNTASFVSFKDRIIDNCSKVIVGKEKVILKVIICYLCSGHILLEDLPGTGKTMLLRSFAKTIGGDFKRIQFTPDLLPSDLTGINFYNQKSCEFEFRKGPLFSQIVLADEINRATPRTQSSLLEAMEERQISVDGITYPLDDAFMVMATQNPLENYGTFPLPEAQTDRFFMRLSLGYMDRQQELSVISRRPAADIINELECTITADETKSLKSQLPQIEVSHDIAGYLMDIIEKTRNDNTISAGVSTRGAIALYKASQAMAALNGRDYVIPEDIIELVPSVLAHRISSGNTFGKSGEEYLRNLMSKIPVPIEKI